MVPYKGFDGLIDALVRYLAGLSPAEQADLLPSSTPALARIFPVLWQLSVVSKLSPVVVGDLLELREIALQTLKSLLSRVASRQPLVLLIDDVQWCDAQSIEMMTRLYAGVDPLPAMLITVHRSEYGDGHSVVRQLRAIRDCVDEERVDWCAETVLPLEPSDTRELALRLLPSEIPNRDAKADWIAGESRGMTLFVYELARHLRGGGEMTETAGLSLDRILLGRIQKLPEDCRRVLEGIAIAGQPVPYAVALRTAGYQSRSPMLLKRLKAAHLVRSSDRPQMVDSFHDRVRESVIAGLDEGERASCHLRLARQWEFHEGVEPETLARHFESGGDSSNAARHYEAAADRAVETLAFNRAEDFFESASRLTQQQAIQIRIAVKRIHFRSNTTRFDEAYQLGRHALAELGMPVPASFRHVPLVRELLVNQLRMRGRSPALIAELPEMTDPQMRYAGRILCAMGKAAFQLEPKLCILILAKAANLGLRHGNWPESVIAYMALGCIFYGGILGWHRLGYQYGQVCLELLEKYENSPLRPEVEFVIGYFTVAWIRPVLETEQLWAQARRHGREVGDHFHFGCACCAETLSRFLRGAPLDEVRRVGTEWIEELERCGQGEPRDAIRSIVAACDLLKLNRATAEDAGVGETSRSLQERMAGFSSRHFAHYHFLVRMIVAYHWGDWEACLQFRSLSASYLSDSKGMLHHAEHHFYAALIDARHPGSGVSRWRTGVRLRVFREVRRFRRLAAQCPETFLARLQLLDAERAVLAGQTEIAVDRLRRAAEHSERQGQRHLEALAHRRLAEIQAPPERISHLKKAGEVYIDWGAKAVAGFLSPSAVHEH
jgi:hypothetical protein